MAQLGNRGECRPVTSWPVAHQAPAVRGILEARILGWVAVPTHTQEIF